MPCNRARRWNHGKAAEHRKVRVPLIRYPAPVVSPPTEGDSQNHFAMGIGFGFVKGKAHPQDGSERGLVQLSS